MKWLVGIFFVITALQGFSQAKYDYNWCFPYHAGINFNDIHPLAFKSNCKFVYSESVSSISDSNGNLQFYLEYEDSLSTGLWYKAYTSNNVLINDSEFISTYASATNGLIIIPYNEGGNNKYCIFHLGDINRCFGVPYAFCLQLFYTTIRKDGPGVFEVEKINEFVVPHLSEKMTAVKHSNGNDWWILVHQMRDTTINAADTYVKVLFSEGRITQVTAQQVGLKDNNSVFGEMTFNRNGNKLVSGFISDPHLDMFDFDRCTGELSNYQMIDSQTAYSVEFSPSGRFLYVVENAVGRLLQYDLQSANIAGSKYIVSFPSTSTAQLQIAPDNKIYFTQLGAANPNPTVQNRSLSVINSPDSAGAACDFQPFSFYLGDSSASGAGLPNMPNYNLGPTSIYQADAGVDTFYCAGDTTTKGPPVGVAPIPGLSYEWQPGPGIDSIHASRQYVKPPTSQWYYLTITDTSIQGSCQSRTDSVYVEVRVCTGLDEPAPNHHVYRLLPNLFNGERTARITLGADEYGKVEIYSMDGRLVGSYRLTAGTNNLELLQNMGTGVFVYQIWVADTIKTNGKLVIMK